MKLFQKWKLLMVLINICIGKSSDNVYKKVQLFSYNFREIKEYLAFKG